MENKKTTELLDLLHKLTDKDGNLLEGWQEVWDELVQRDPFCLILNEDSDCGLSSLQDEIIELKDEIKRLKRHKHDEKTGDVLIRI
ncbi:unnamed protein product [marine sediment metagenome]|uniref:Uncharacterized protein n=1 Tax=marine sediment metagenome TaxID=412755 RepID=X1JUW2_9ZZZZ